MRSPFAIFRKYQKTAMVVLTVLAMFAFVVLDSVSQMDRLPPTLVVIIIAPLVAGVGWLLGLRSGNGKEFALVGAAVGALGGVLLTRLSEPLPAVETHVESISQQELNEMVRRRQVANQFLERAFIKAMGDDRNMAMMVGFWRNQWLFGYGRDLEQDVALAHLYGYEADDLDIRVPDEAITNYIHQATQNKLSAQDFREIRNEMRLSEAGLYDILREQLRARRAVELLSPRTMATPEEYWQLYRKLHVRESLDVAAVPVDQFEAQTPEPTETDLVALFEQFKNAFPDPRVVDTTPKFGQPRKVRVAYVEADYDTFAQNVPEVTDAEIEAFYRTNPLPEPHAESSGEEESNPLDPEFTPDPSGAAQPESGESGSGESAEPSGEASDEPPDSDSADAGDAEDKTVTDSGLDAEDEGDAGSSKTEPVVAPRPASEPAEGPAAETAAEEPAPADEEPLPEFQPLDEELREDIRDQLLNERTQQAMRDAIEQAYAFMYSLSDQYYAYLPEEEEPTD